MDNVAQTIPEKAKLKRKEYEEELRKTADRSFQATGMGEAQRAAHHCHL
jgi:hypothetical protein